MPDVSKINVYSQDDLQDWTNDFISSPNEFSQLGSPPAQLRTLTIGNPPAQLRTLTIGNTLLNTPPTNSRANFKASTSPPKVPDSRNFSGISPRPCCEEGKTTTNLN